MSYLHISIYYNPESIVFTTNQFTGKKARQNQIQLNFVRIFVILMYINALIKVIQ